MLKLSDFDYVLPKELIAKYPLKQRDEAKLLVLNRAQGTIEHRIFKDLLDYLKKNDLLVVNTTKVLPSRLIGSRITGGRVDILLLSQKRDLTFAALIRPGRIKIKEKILFNGKNIYAEVTDKNEVTLFAKDIDEVYGLGKMPLPPYIKRDPEDLDDIYYQTVYAKDKGSVASPTAGLHFTDELMGQIKNKGVNIAKVTLHISYSTFKPVKAEDISAHKMEKEYFCVSQDAQRLIKETRVNNARVFAVGTTSLRTLETYASLGIEEGHTDLFIYPGYNFKAVDCLLTNFHLPRTTLFILACAFATEGLIRKAYQEAIDKGYRFYSYGDAMLII
jgi:S-adenosylmethionine:tRNA ribosyltransferase-isomerase